MYKVCRCIYNNHDAESNKSPPNIKPAINANANEKNKKDHTGPMPDKSTNPGSLRFTHPARQPLI